MHKLIKSILGGVIRPPFVRPMGFEGPFATPQGQHVCLKCNLRV